MSNTFTIIESRVGDFTDFVRFCSVIGFDTCWECPNHNVTAFGQTRFAVFGFVLNGGKAKWVFATLNVFRAFDFTFGGIGITNCWSNTLLTTLNFSFILKFLTGSLNFLPSEAQILSACMLPHFTINPQTSRNQIFYWYWKVKPTELVRNFRWPWIELGLWIEGSISYAILNDGCSDWRLYLCWKP